MHRLQGVTRRGLLACPERPESVVRARNAENRDDFDYMRLLDKANATQILIRRPACVLQHLTEPVPTETLVGVEMHSDSSPIMRPPVN